MTNSNRLPWMIAACAVFFALGVLLTAVLLRNGGPQTVQAVPVAATPAPGSSGQGAVPSRPPGQGALPSEAADSGRTTPVPSPAPSPTPAVIERPGHLVTGTVTDLQGKPVPEATVLVFFDEHGSQAKVEVQADNDGKFAARNLPVARAQTIVAEAPGYARSDPMPPFDLPLEGLEISLRRMAGAELTLLDARGEGDPKPFEGPATIYVMRQNSADLSTSTLGIEEPGLANGQFMAVLSEPVNVKGGRHPIRGLEPGIYKAAVVAQGAGYAEGEPFRVDATEGGQSTVVIGQRQTLIGYIKSDPEQSPITGARVILQSVGRPAVVGAAPVHRTETATDGKFSLEGVTPGDYRLTLAATGFATKTLDQIKIPPGTPPAPATFYLVREQPAIQVAVYGAGGRGLAKAPLVLIATGAGARARSYFAKTDDSGQHRFEALPPGRYSLAVTSPEDKKRQKVMELVVNERETTGPVTVRFAPTVRVAGQVERKGKRLTETLLSFVPRGALAPELFVKTDEEGNYAVDLEPGEYMAGEARQEGRVVVKVETGEFQSADMQLP